MKKKTLKIKEIFLDWKQRTNYTAIKDITNIFRLEKEAKAIKDRILKRYQEFFWLRWWGRKLL